MYKCENSLLQFNTADRVAKQGKFAFYFLLCKSTKF